MPSVFRRFDLFWLLLTIIALSVSGIYSFAVSMMRIPAIYKIFHLPDFFKISLVIHVTLSINIWFMLFGLYHMGDFLKKSLITKSAKYLSGVSLFLMIISGFVPNSTAITINYIPIIDNIFFISGLILFFVVFAIISIATITKLIKEKFLLVKSDLVHHFLFSISFTSIFAFLCLIASIITNFQYIENIKTFNLEEFSWGIGHIMQFVFVEIGFLSLTKNLSIYNKFLQLNEYPKWLNKFLIIKISIVAISPFFYFFHNYYEIFTWHMRYGLAIFILPILFLLVKKLKHDIKTHYFHYSIIGFILYFFINIYGGVLGFSIREINATVPAHYHGSLISITILLMSFFYGTMSYLGKKIDLRLLSISMRRTIFSQLISYGLGNSLHITGLMMMGGYGALRKTPGGVPIEIFIGKIIFIVGSILSIVSGIVFIALSIILMKKICKKRTL